MCTSSKQLTRQLPTGGSGLSLHTNAARGARWLGHPPPPTHHAGALADVLLHQLRPDDADEAGIGAVGHRSGQQRFACERGRVRRSVSSGPEAPVLQDPGHPNQ